MKILSTFAALLLAANSCSYSTASDSRAPSLANSLTQQQQLCVEERLASGWDLKLSDLERDLSPEQEIAVDMAIELCRLDTSSTPTVPSLRNEQPQVSEELLKAPVALSHFVFFLIVLLYFLCLFFLNLARDL